MRMYNSNEQYDMYHISHYLKSNSFYDKLKMLNDPKKILFEKLRKDL